MYSDSVTRYALDGTLAGSAGPGATVGVAGDESCGDRVRIELAVADGRVVAARHRSRACPHATAAAALVCRWAEGRELLDAARIGQAAVEAELRPSGHGSTCAAVALDALHAAVGPAVNTTRLAPKAGRIAVAMSGGGGRGRGPLKTGGEGRRGGGGTPPPWGRS